MYLIKVYEKYAIDKLQCYLDILQLHVIIGV